MAIDDVIGVRLRQAFFQDLEVLAAIARARHHELAVTRDALLVLGPGHEPGGVRLLWVHDHREPEDRRLDPGDLAEGLALVGGDEDAVVMLHPHALGRSPALRETM